MAGDSTTWALKGLASEIARKELFNIAIFAQDSAFPSAKLSCGDVPRCRENNALFKMVFDYVIRWSRPGDVVLITGNIAGNFCVLPELYCRNTSGENLDWKEVEGGFLSINDALDFFLNEMGELKKVLDKKQVRLIVSAPLPQWENEHKIYCEKQWFRPKSESDKCFSPNYSEQEKSRSRIVSILNKAKDKYGFLIYDPFPFFCNERACNFSNPNTNENYWIDETHLSTMGGQRLSVDFSTFLANKGILAPSIIEDTHKTSVG